MAEEVRVSYGTWRVLGMAMPPTHDPRPCRYHTPCVRACHSPDPTRRAGAWKEHKAPDGRSYYYNRITKESRWTMPDELKAKMAGSAPGASAATADEGPPTVL
jgi:hypothetical protein